MVVDVGFKLYSKKFQPMGVTLGQGHIQNFHIEVKTFCIKVHIAILSRPFDFIDI